MRNLKSFDIHGKTVQGVLDEFNERHKEFEVEDESQIVSISTRSAVEPHKLATSSGNVDSKVIVTIVCWV